MFRKIFITFLVVALSLTLASCGSLELLKNPAFAEFFLSDM